MRGLYVVAAVTMAGVSSVFVLLAELEHRYDLPTAGLGWIAGSAFAAALVTQLTLARYADRGHGALLLRAGVVAAAAGLLWFAAATELWEFVAARALLGAGVGMIIPPARRAIVLTARRQAGRAPRRLLRRLHRRVRVRAADRRRPDRHRRRAPAVLRARHPRRASRLFSLEGPRDARGRRRPTTGARRRSGCCAASSAPGAWSAPCS